MSKNTETKTLRVVTKKPGMVNPSKVETIEHSLSAMQKLVAPMSDPNSSNLIEPVRVPELQDQGIDLYANEEGLFNGCRPNMLLFDGQVQIVGPVFFVSFNDETGESVSLTDEQVEFAQAWLTRQPRSVF